LKISIIVPVYNVEHYLKECVDSLIDQDYENKEIILVDDGSPDGCPAICDAYSEQYDFIKTIHKENGGLSDARNTGLTHATGDYILFVDSDDFIEKNSLSKIVETVTESQADVVFLEAKKYLPDGTTISLGNGITKEGVQNKSYEDALRFISSCPKYPASACTKLMKKSLFHNGSLNFEKGLLSEDLDWCLKLLLKAKSFDYYGGNYYYYRQGRSDSITNKVGLKNFLDILYIIKKWIALSEQVVDYERHLILSELAYEYPIEIAIYSKLSKADKKKYKSEMKTMSWLLRYRKGFKYKIMNLIYKIFGIDFLGFLLKTYLKVR